MKDSVKELLPSRHRLQNTRKTLGKLIRSWTCVGHPLREGVAGFLLALSQTIEDDDDESLFDFFFSQMTEPNLRFLIRTLFENSTYSFMEQGCYQ
jgi:hypothetical protein